MKSFLNLQFGKSTQDNRVIDKNCSNLVIELCGVLFRGGNVDNVGGADLLSSLKRCNYVVSGEFTITFLRTAQKLCGAGKRSFAIQTRREIRAAALV
jgi:hypothetical protein